MNSYNQNLQTTVINSLLDLELDKKSMKAKLEAAMLSLYYSEAARVTAALQLEKSNKNYTFTQEVLQEAVNNNNIANNLLASANEQKRYVSQAVTNAAVAAASVQVAANAILRLASDVGSIMSIVNAADYNTEIYVQASEAYRLINNTAYEAEVASQQAMETSTATAKISSGIVADMAKVTTDSVNNLYAVVNTAFTNATNVVANDNSTLDKASASEKLAEGVLEYTNVEYYASSAAYELSNRELNLNLRVPRKNRHTDRFKVLFDYYKSPFNKHAKTGYPVKSYNIMLVKNDVSPTFSMGMAEGLMQNKGQYISIPGLPEKDKHEVSVTIKVDSLLDSDGKPLELGTMYTVFVLVILVDEYKKHINNFDDYLTAPSEPFKLTHHLHVPIPSKSNIIIKDPTTKPRLTFSLEENKKFNAEYRCMFLPLDRNLTKGMLTEQGLKDLEKEIERLEEIGDKYNPLIQAILVEIADTKTILHTIDEELVNLRELLEEATSEKQRKAINKDIDAATRKREQTKKDLDELYNRLNKQEQDKANDAYMIKSLKPPQIGFFFNKKIAEQITIANYLVAHTTVAPKGADKVEIQAETLILPEATDVFGNRLVEGKSYVPVVLAHTKAGDGKENEFTPELSHFETTEAFTYQHKK